MARLFTRADHLASVGTGWEPQRQHNWALELNLAGDNDIITLSISTGFLPVGSNEELPVPYGNEVVYVAGKAVWEAGTIVCRDYIDRPVAQLLLNWRTEVYDPTTGAIGLSGGFGGVPGYKRNASIITFPPNVIDGSERGVPYQKVWTIYGAWPLRVNPAANGLDMNTSGQVMIELVLRFDKATASHITNYKGGAIFT